MTTEKRIEIAARLLGDLARVSLTPEDIKARCRDALDIVDALENVAVKKTRYDWSKAPKDAKIAVTEAVGTICFGSYSDATPMRGGFEGVGVGEWLLFDSNHHPCTDWRDSLERRPE